MKYLGLGKEKVYEQRVGGAVALCLCCQHRGTWQNPLGLQSGCQEHRKRCWAGWIGSYQKCQSPCSMSYHSSRAEILVLCLASVGTSTWHCDSDTENSLNSLVFQPWQPCILGSA